MRAANRARTRALGGRRRRRLVARVGAGLRGGSVPANADGGWLHDIARETYVVAPACFEAFAARRDLAAATVRNRVVRLPALIARAGVERSRPG